MEQREMWSEEERICTFMNNVHMYVVVARNVKQRDQTSRAGYGLNSTQSLSGGSLFQWHPQQPLSACPLARLP